MNARATAPTVASAIATRLIGPYDAIAYGRLKIPTPMMLPMTRLVDWGRLRREVLAGVVGRGSTGELCGHDSSSVSPPSDRMGQGAGYGLRP